MEFISNYGLFLLKTITIVVALLVLMAAMFMMRKKDQDTLSVSSLSEKHDELSQKMLHQIHNEKPIKGKAKKKYKVKQDQKPNLYVIDFSGDIKASQAESLRQSVNAVLASVRGNDEVLIRLESPGGSVNGYGLAASQLQRIRDKNIPLTVCIDKVAASGGYLMACVANTIVAAPFAIIGSIGVVAQLPNFHRWLKKHNIDFELLTAGEFKRTLTIFGENDEKGRSKFKEDLELIHKAFRDYVVENRQHLNIDEVATGEHWLATDAYRLRLIDKLQTSDDCIFEKMQQFRVWLIESKTPVSLLSRILKPAANLMHPWA